MTISDVSVTEGNSGTKAATFTVTLSPTSTQAVTVGYATANGTATAGSDYVATSGTLTFAAGVSTQTIAVTINGDATVETDETVLVNLSGATNATIGDAQGIGTITNDDQPSLAINDVSVSEGNSGTKTATFTVTLSPTSTQAVTVGYATANGTATAGSDYVDDERDADLRGWRQHADDRGHDQRRRDGRIGRDRPGQPERRDERDDRRRAGCRHDHQRRQSVLDDQRRERDRGQQRHEDGDVHGDAVADEHADGDGGLCDRERDGDRR